MSELVGLWREHFRRFAVLSIVTFITITRPELIAAQETESVRTLDAQAVAHFFDGAVSGLMRTNNTPSGVVVLAQGNEVIYARGFGFQDIEAGIPVDPNTTLFRTGSVSKLATWVAVMQLVEQGKLDLDENVNAYLTNFTIKDTFATPITLRDIMTHSAGFEDGSLGYLIKDDPDSIIPLSESMARYQPERVNPPGKQTAYSNYATALAGLIVSNVSGQAFNDYVRDHIFAPLAMNQSSFEEPLPPDLASNMAKSYGAEGGDFVEGSFEIISNFGPAGSQSATGTNMVRFARAILNGGELDGQRILEPQTVQEMLDRHFAHDQRLTAMGLGFYGSDYEGTIVMGHGGDTRYFHSYLGIDREHDLTFFTSFGASGGSTVRSVLLPAFYAEFFPRSATPEDTSEASAVNAHEYAGTYGFWRSSFSKIEKALGISGGITIAPLSDQELMVVLGGNAKKYVAVAQDLFRESNSGVSLISGMSPRLLAFQRDELGEVTGAVMDGLPFMSLRKLAIYETPNFNLTLLTLSLAMMLWLLLRRFFQRATIKNLSVSERRALSAAVWGSAAHWWVVLSGTVVLTALGDSLFSSIPMLFKAWLVFPIIATLITVYLVYKTFNVWRQRLTTSTWSRLRYTCVMLGSVFMSWFYHFWNILGFQYLE
jgi:CubicO group peptidase (beta-lactamase class C family)